MLWPLLCLLVSLQNRFDISLYIYISVTRLWLSILPLQRRDYYYITMASIYISGRRYFSLSAYQSIKWYLESHLFQFADISWHRSKSQYADISWHQSKSPNHRLFQFARESTHQSVTLITVYFGMLAYHGINHFSHRQFWLSNISRHWSQN
jgi:hypothetical protein